jgi:hypothetical protein
MWTTVSVYGATVTEVALPDALVIDVPLLASVYTVGAVVEGVKPLRARLTA